MAQTIMCLLLGAAFAASLWLVKVSGTITVAGALWGK